MTVGFRNVFNKKVSTGSWFPLHMATGLKKIQRYLREIDCVIEVHDARIPLSGRSTNFHRQVIANRPHLLIFNKMDLIDMNFKTDIDQKLVGTCDRILYTKSDAFPRNIEQIIPTIVELTQQKHRFHREDRHYLQIMVVGIPNVGKSSLINTLRNSFLGVAGKAMAVAPYAGVTKTLSERVKISNNPPVYLVDTPGILEPNFDILESPFRLGLCGTTNDSLFGSDLLVDYMLYWLNKRRLFHYVNILNLPHPTDNINELLIRVAMNNNFVSKRKDITTRQEKLRFDLHKSALYILNLFRKGSLGLYLLDDDILFRPTRQVEILQSHNAVDKIN